MFCWNCKVGEYLVYKSDATHTPRCGSCGELKQDAPRAIPAESRPTPVRRGTAKAKEKA